MIANGGTVFSNPAIKQQAAADVNTGGVTVLLNNGVVQVPTTTVLTIAPPLTIPFGHAVSGTAQVTASDGSVLTGTISFFDGATNLCTISVAASACPAGSGAGFAVGTHVLTAVYSGDATHLPSTSAPVTVIVQAVATKAQTVTMLTSSTNPATSGQSVTFTANVGVSGSTLFRAVGDGYVFRREQCAGDQDAGWIGGGEFQYGGADCWESCDYSELCGRCELGCKCFGGFDRDGERNGCGGERIQRFGAGDGEGRGGEFGESAGGRGSADGIYAAGAVGLCRSAFGGGLYFWLEDNSCGWRKYDASAEHDGSAFLHGGRCGIADGWFVSGGDYGCGFVDAPASE